MNIFDSLQTSAFNTVAASMGYGCSWLPSAGGSVQFARVLYKTPTDKEKYVNVDYHLGMVSMEYKEGDLPGLKEASDNNIRETVTIDGKDHMVMSVSKKFDGKTIDAMLKIL